MTSAPRRRRRAAGAKAAAAAALLLALAACNTVRGVGADIEAGGEALGDAAREVQRSLP